MLSKALLCDWFWKYDNGKGLICQSKCSVGNSIIKWNCLATWRVWLGTFDGTYLGGYLHASGCSEPRHCDQQFLWFKYLKDMLQKNAHRTSLEKCHYEVSTTLLQCYACLIISDSLIISDGKMKRMHANLWVFQPSLFIVHVVKLHFVVKFCHYVSNKPQFPMWDIAFVSTSECLHAYACSCMYLHPQSTHLSLNSHTISFKLS